MKRRFKAFLSMATIAVAAFGAATLSPVFAKAEEGDEIESSPVVYDYDFSEATHAEIFEPTTEQYSVNGWDIRDEKLYPAVDWSTVNTVEKISLAEDMQISFDLYLDPNEAAKQFNFGFFADLATANQVGSGKNYKFNNRNLWVCSSTGNDGWIADVVPSYNYYEGKERTVDIVIKDGEISIKVEGVSYDMLATETVADDAYIVMQASSKNTYIDNFYMGEIRPETVKPVDELSLTFDGLEDDLKFVAFEHGGWGTDSGKFGGEFYPVFGGNASSYLKYPVPMDGEKYISFDLYMAKDVKDETATRFDVLFMNDFSLKTVTAGLHFHYETLKPVATVNKAIGAENPTGKTSVNWSDGKYHNVKISIKDGVFGFAVDGETLMKNETEELTLLMEANEKTLETFLTFKATNEMTRIDNLVISNVDIAYEPTTETPESFTEFTHTFDTATDAAEYARAMYSGGDWTATADGKFSAGAAWAVSYLNREIPLTEEKTVKFNFRLTNGGAGDSAHQFLVGFGCTPDSYVGWFITFYQGIVRLNYYLGPTSRIVASHAYNYFDDTEHEMKIIVEDGAASVLIDDGIIFKYVQLGMGKGYLKLQSSNTTDYIDNLTVKNVAEPVSVPNTDGDNAYAPDGTAGKPNASAKGNLEQNGVWVALTIVFAVLTAAALAATVFVFIKKPKTTDGEAPSEEE